MSTLTVTTRGQVTFRKEVLQRLAIKPGERIDLDLLPDGKAQLKLRNQKARSGRCVASSKARQTAPG